MGLHYFQYTCRMPNFTLDLYDLSPDQHHYNLPFLLPPAEMEFIPKLRGTIQTNKVSVRQIELQHNMNYYTMILFGTNWLCGVAERVFSQNESKIRIIGRIQKDL
jgi:hypothetical protein